MSDTAFIEPLRITRVIDGITVEIWPLQVGMLPKLLGLVEPLTAELAALVGGGTIDRITDGQADADDVAELVSLLASHGDALLDAVALLARADRDWVRGLLPDRAVSLTADVIKVNADFFRQTIQRVRDSGESLADLVRKSPAEPAAG